MNYYDLELFLISQEKKDVSKFVMSRLINCDDLQTSPLVKRLIDNKVMSYDGRYHIRKFIETYEGIIDRYAENIPYDKDAYAELNALEEGLNKAKAKIKKLGRKRKHLDELYNFIKTSKIRKSQLEEVIQSNQKRKAVMFVKRYLKMVIDNREKEYQSFIEDAKKEGLTTPLEKIGVLKMVQKYVLNLPFHLNGKINYEFFIKTTLTSLKEYIKDYL